MPLKRFRIVVELLEKLIFLPRLCCCRNKKFCNKCHALKNNECSTAVSKASVAICSSYFIHSNIIPWGINSEKSAINGLVSGWECERGKCVREVGRLERGGGPRPLHHKLLQHLALHIHQPPVSNCLRCCGNG